MQRCALGSVFQNKHYFTSASSFTLRIALIMDKGGRRATRAWSVPECSTDGATGVNGQGKRSHFNTQQAIQDAPLAVSRQKQCAAAQLTTCTSPFSRCRFCGAPFLGRRVYDSRRQR